MYIFFIGKCDETTVTREHYRTAYTTAQSKCQYMMMRRLVRATPAKCSLSMVRGKGMRIGTDRWMLYTQYSRN